MSGADGMEQATAELDERHETAELDADMHELLADEERSVVVLSDAERITELKALLADIRLGADMMLEPVLGLKGAMLGYVKEVRRVADAGRTV
jgi:hypothetical protein